MVSTPLAAGFACLGAAPAALNLYISLQARDTSTQDPPIASIGSAFQAPLPPLVATASFFTTVVFMYRNLGRAGTRLSEVVAVGLSAAFGLLELRVVLPGAGGMGDGVAQARALGLAAAHALPAAAAMTFFLGVVLVFVHIRAGGEGGGTRIQALVGVLTKMAVAAATGLFGMMAMASLYYSG